MFKTSHLILTYFVTYEVFFNNMIENVLHTKYHESKLRTCYERQVEFNKHEYIEFLKHMYHNLCGH